eukprot:CAMPEP_0198214972 /NCGR_PEP_ID=MMETSP1445-20131203/45915_1 /TAXON_ID=36898 /ORGANISM="Pyramimonas sp., Strain CCMP2087" /LENGTH=48 /DNA_ID= /DNA_START= /DNA_END= /DNA_ORIENTATION=
MTIRTRYGFCFWQTERMPFVERPPRMNISVLVRTARVVREGDPKGWST